ncbi:MAG: hypothetical protein V4594_11900 [Bacteroidota bacterium]
MPRFLLPILLFFLIVTGVSPVVAQSDTTAYQLQRLKVNALLAQRSQKFGQYDQSLDQRTGIFGFQTKQDIKNSNEILRQIVLNDNNIFKELKILMDYKDQEVQAIQRSAGDASNRIQSYKTAIKKLQDQNELLKNEADRSKSGGVLVIFVIILLSAALVGTIYFFRRKLKAAGQ